MYNAGYYSKPTVRSIFKRWTNAGYSVFNSLNRIVHIGCISGLINKIATVKSPISKHLIQIFAELSSDTHEPMSEDELMVELIPVISGYLEEVLSISNVASKEFPLGGQSTSFLFISKEIYQRAYCMPFFYLYLGCNDSGSFLHTQQRTGILFANFSNQLIFNRT